MLGRLGTVIYWIGCILAGLTAAMAVLLFMSEGYARKDGPLVTVLILVVASIIWLAGYAPRYILAGPRQPLLPRVVSAPSWEETYAKRIHVALPASDSLGEMTPEKLRIPPAATNRFFEKALVTRESICFVALAAIAKPETKLPPVLAAYANLAAHRLTERGLLADADAFADASFSDVDTLFKHPYEWTQSWLAEFRNDPSDTYMVTAWANHCQKLFQAHQQSIQETYNG